MTDLLEQVAQLPHYEYIPFKKASAVKSKNTNDCPQCGQPKKYSAQLCLDCWCSNNRPPETPDIFFVDNMPCRKVPAAPHIYTLVDSCLYDYIMRWRWSAAAGPDGAMRIMATLYHKDFPGGRRVAIANVLLSKHPDIIFDHVNRNPLDNRICNFRPSTVSANCANRRKRRDNASGFIGVSAKKGGFVADTTYRRTHIYIGYFRSKEEAAKARDRKVLELFGEFANLNFPRETYL